MSNKLIWGQVVVVALTLAFGMLFMRGVRAQEVQAGVAVICDTREQIEEFVALNGGKEALQKVNAAANVCGVVMVMYETVEAVGHVQTSQGLASIVKISVIGFNLGIGWMTAGEPLVQYTLILVPGRDT